MDNVEAKALGKAFRCQTHRVTVSDVEGNTLVNTLGDTLAKVKAITIGNKKGDIEVEAPNYTLPDTLT